MSALLPYRADDYFLATYGKLAALGSFRVETEMRLVRGERVVVRGPRGVETARIVRPASVQQSRQIGDAGVILRRVSAEDERRLEARRRRSEDVFALARAIVVRESLALEVLDVDLPLEGDAVYLQVLAPGDFSAASIADAVRDGLGLELRLENLAAPVAADAAHGCGKPDCGAGQGGCSSCGSGGGCASGCGRAAVDLRDYFAHLRGQMEERQRVPLL